MMAKNNQNRTMLIGLFQTGCGTCCVQEAAIAPTNNKAIVTRITPCRTCATRGCFSLQVDINICQLFNPVIGNFLPLVNTQRHSCQQFCCPVKPHFFLWAQDWRLLFCFLWGFDSGLFFGQFVGLRHFVVLSVMC